MLSVQGNYNLLRCNELFSMDCNGSLEGGGSRISKLDNHCCKSGPHRKYWIYWIHFGHFRYIVCLVLLFGNNVAQMCKFWYGSFKVLCIKRILMHKIGCSSHPCIIDFMQRPKAKRYFSTLDQAPSVRQEITKIGRKLTLLSGIYGKLCIF